MSCELVGSQRLGGGVTKTRWWGYRGCVTSSAGRSRKLAGCGFQLWSDSDGCSFVALSKSTLFYSNRDTGLEINICTGHAPTCTLLHAHADAT